MRRNNKHEIVTYVSSFLETIKGGWTRQSTNALIQARYPCDGWYAVISNIFQYIIFYCPPYAREGGGGGASRVMRDIWYKVGTQLRYAIFFFQRTMVRLKRNIFLRRWLDIFLQTAQIGPIILDMGMFTMLVCYWSCSERWPLCYKLARGYTLIQYAFIIN